MVAAQYNKPVLLIAIYSAARPSPHGLLLLERARGRRAEATPRSYFEMEGGPEPAGGLTVTTENKMLA